jgi:hypothetical protein
MRTLIFSIATATMFLTAPAFAVPLTCNSAVQNWQNGSSDTCPYGGGNGTVTQIIVFETYTPPVLVEEEPLEEPVD